jgi:SOS response regulatory protein OraA/RecX
MMSDTNNTTKRNPPVPRFSQWARRVVESGRAHGASVDRIRERLQDAGLDALILNEQTIWGWFERYDSSDQFTAHAEAYLNAAVDSLLTSN